MSRVPDYDQLSATYDSRYGVNGLCGIETALRSMAARTAVRRVLEVGCGTGRWLEALRAGGSATVVGVDASPGMLAQAARRDSGAAGLLAAAANSLPFAGPLFDFICCVNALHHFDDPADFLRNAATLLRLDGTLAVVAIDPRTIRHRYHYDYFEGARELDLRRYPSFGQITDWLCEAGLDEVELRVVEKSVRRFEGEAVLRDPFLAKHSDSTMALLSDDAYEAGLQRLREAASSPAQLVFRSEMNFCMLTAIARQENRTAPSA